MLSLDLIPTGFPSAAYTCDEELRSPTLLERKIWIQILKKDEKLKWSFFWSLSFQLSHWGVVSL